MISGSRKTDERH